MADALVLGDHPAASRLAGTLAGQGRRVTLARGRLPDAGGLTIVNADAAGHGLDCGGREVAGVRFVDVHSDKRADPELDAGAGPVAWVTRAEDAADAAFTAATAAGVSSAESVEFGRADEQGVDVTIDGGAGRVALVAVADAAPGQLDGLGVSPAAATHRLLRMDFPASYADEQWPVTVGPDVGGQLVQGRLLVGPERGQADVLVPLSLAGSAESLLASWIEVLRSHALLTRSDDGWGGPFAVDLAVEQAMRHDVVGDRAVVVGPAGGFVAASGEDVYPGLLSADFAAEAMGEALSADFAQDALAAFRGSWGASLGEYLVGPQQNLRFLLPLVWQNPAMAARLSDALLKGISLVR